MPTIKSVRIGRYVNASHQTAKSTFISCAVSVVGRREHPKSSSATSVATQRKRMEETTASVVLQAPTITDCDDSLGMTIHFFALLPEKSITVDHVHRVMGM